MELPLSTVPKKESFLNSIILVLFTTATKTCNNWEYILNTAGAFYLSASVPNTHHPKKKPCALAAILPTTTTTTNLVFSSSSPSMNMSGSQGFINAKQALCQWAPFHPRPVSFLLLYKGSYSVAQPGPGFVGNLPASTRTASVHTIRYGLLRYRVLIWYRFHSSLCIRPLAYSTAPMAEWHL